MRERALSRSQGRSVQGYHCGMREPSLSLSQHRSVQGYHSHRKKSCPYQWFASVAMRRKLARWRTDCDSLLSTRESHQILCACRDGSVFARAASNEDPMPRPRARAAVPNHESQIVPSSKRLTQKPISPLLSRATSTACGSSVTSERSPSAVYFANSARLARSL